MNLSSVIFLQKIFNNSVNANQHPEKFYDKRGNIKIKDERKDNQRRARRIENRIRQSLAFNASGLQ